MSCGVCWSVVSPGVLADRFRRFGSVIPEAVLVLRPGTAARCPILALHGDLDTVTPLNQVREFAATLGEQVSLVVYPDEGHGLSRPKNIQHAMYAELVHYRAALED